MFAHLSLYSVACRFHVWVVSGSCFVGVSVMLRGVSVVGGVSVMAWCWLGTSSWLDIVFLATLRVNRVNYGIALQHVLFWKIVFDIALVNKQMSANNHPKYSPNLGGCFAFGAAGLILFM